jgi:acyl-CoA reductase-like NAD-dependent aldehyde dehydrogenase
VLTVTAFVVKPGDLPGQQVAYGLAAGVWTRDLELAHRVVRALRAGTVWVAFNQQPGCRWWLQEWLRPGVGSEVLDAYTQIKSVTSGQATPGEARR